MDGPQSPRKATVAFIFVTIALDVLAIGITAPVIPKLIGGFLQNNTAHTAEMMGLFATVWAVIQLLVSPLLGVLSDRFGRRPVILLSSLGMGIDYFVMAVAPSLSWLFVGRMISGVASASAPTAMAYIADTTPAEKRSAAFGVVSAGFGVGFVLGPALGGVLGSIDWRLPFWAAGAFSLLNTLYGAFVLPESLAKDKRRPLTFRRLNPFGPLALLGRHKPLLRLALVSFLGLVTQQIFASIYVVYVDYRYQWSERTVGFSLALVAICTAATGALLVKILVKRMGDRKVMLAGLLLGGVGFVAMGWATTGALFLVSIPVMNLWSLAGPTGQSLMTGQVDVSEQGELQGAMSSLRGLAGLIGPGIFAGIFAWSIRAGGGPHMPGAAFYAGAGLLFTSLLVGLWRQ